MTKARATHTKRGAPGDQNYKFTGQERDSESNLDNFLARYDSWQIGRFMSPDPENADADVSDPQTLNLYSYVRDNPLNMTDPSGMQSQNNGQNSWQFCNSVGTAYEACWAAYLHCDPALGCTPSDPRSWPWDPGPLNLAADSNWDIFDLLNIQPFRIQSSCDDWSCGIQNTGACTASMQSCGGTPDPGHPDGSTPPTSDDAIAAISAELAPLNKLQDCAVAAAVDQVPLGIGDKLVGIPSGPSDPVGTAVGVAKAASDNKAAGTVVLAMNKADLPYLSELVENSAVKVIRAVSPYAEKLNIFGWAWMGYQVGKQTHACYAHQ